MRPDRLHFYLSPHLDDAVFSCGGMIHRQTSAGDRVVVATVFSGDPPAGEISPYAAGLHARWGMPATADRPPAGDDARAMVARRRAEDAAALGILGAEVVHFDVPDVIYRRTDAGGWVVDSDADLFMGFNPAEGTLVGRLAAELARRIELELEFGRGDRTATTRATVYVPLAVGDHVDHHLVRRAAERWAAGGSGEVGHGLAQPRSARFAFYEDYPYAENDDAVARAVENGSASFARGDAATLEHVSPSDWRAIPVRLDPVDVAAKIDAVAAYGSQISSFWRDRDDMAAAIGAFARRRAVEHGCGAEAYVERLWVPRTGGGGASGFGSALRRW